MITDARGLSLPFAFSAAVKTTEYLPMRPAIFIVVVIIIGDGELATAEVWLDVRVDHLLNRYPVLCCWYHAKLFWSLNISPFVLLFIIGMKFLTWYFIFKTQSHPWWFNIPTTCFSSFGRSFWSLKLISCAQCQIELLKIKAKVKHPSFCTQRYF